MRKKEVRRKVLIGLLTAAMINGTFATPSFVANAQTADKAEMETASEADFASNRVIVSVKEGTDMKAVKDSVDVKSVKLLDNGKTPGEKSTGYKIYQFTLKEKDKQNVLDSAEALKDVKGVSCAEPDYIIRVDGEKGKEVNDPLFEQQTNLNQVKAPVCWNVTTGKDVVVGVIDTGIDYTHPDLADNMWKNPGEIADDGIDNDGNGYIDDVYGYNFADGNNDPMDTQFHGSHVAGIIGASANNGIGVAGIAPNVKLAAIKFIGDSGIGYLKDAISAVRYARIMHMPITNNSWGIGEGVRDLYLEVAGSGLFVAAAGNSGENNDVSEHVPASWKLDNIISVANVDSEGKLWNTSNWGPTSVDIAAPGVSVVSTYNIVEGKKAYGPATGTSMAAPHVTGAAALILSLHPEYTTAQLKEAILNSADKTQELNGKVLTGGILNVAKALGNVTTYQGVDYKDVFDYDTYRCSFQDVYYVHGTSPIEALDHFVNVGMKEGRPGNDTFYPRSYAKRYPELEQQFGTDWSKYYLHYMNIGKAEGRDGSLMSE